MAVAILFGLYASSTYATMSELLPTKVRSTGIAIAYNIPVAMFGGSAPLISTWLIQWTGDLSSPWYFYVSTGIASIVALLFLRESDFVGSTTVAQSESSQKTLALLRSQGSSV
jgi:MHS family proline/betaine transporter-like MFS transporter